MKEPTANDPPETIWVAFDPMFGKRAILDEVYTEDPGKWALRYTLDTVQEPGVIVPKKDTKELVNKFLPCLCHEAFSARSLRDPQCPRCNYADDLIKAIEDFVTAHPQGDKKENDGGR